MEYTFQQKIAIMRILLDIIHADGIIDARETFFFNKLKEKFELQDEDHELVKSKNSLIALSQIKLLSDEQKADFAGLMSDMIIVDEDINANRLPYMILLLNSVESIFPLKIQQVRNIYPSVQGHNNYILA